MQSSSKQLIDLLINSRATGAKAAAGEILRLREGVQDVIEALRAGRDAELCARRLEMLLGLRKSLNDTPRRRSARIRLPDQRTTAKPAAEARKRTAN